MNNRTLIITGCSSYLIFLLLLVPANQILTVFKPTLNNITLNGISGSIWSGSIQSLSVKNQLLNTTSWSLKPLSLLSANIGLDLETEIAGQKLVSKLNYSLITKSVSLSQLHSLIDASAIQALLQLPFGELNGNIELSLQQLQLMPGKLPVVTGKVNWDNALINLYSSINLGNLSLDLSSADNGDITGALANSGGEVSISGQIKVSSNKRYHLDLRLKPRSNASKDLLNILSMVAPKKIKSEHVLNRSGQLSEFGIL
ncbi:MAG: type II secretion system protein N [Gammaproteobacteria bacterium]|nr:type II secretion system protein N [Gammaproteobacteria bacterium]